MKAAWRAACNGEDYDLPIDHPNYLWKMFIWEESQLELGISEGVGEVLDREWTKQNQSTEDELNMKNRDRLPQEVKDKGIISNAPWYMSLPENMYE